jgi:hypothetical protein
MRTYLIANIIPIKFSLVNSYKSYKIGESPVIYYVIDYNVYMKRKFTFFTLINWLQNYYKINHTVTIDFTFVIWYNIGVKRKAVNTNQFTG